MRHDCKITFIFKAIKCIGLVSSKQTTKLLSIDLATYDCVRDSCEMGLRNCFLQYIVCEACLKGKVALNKNHFEEQGRLS